MDAEAIKRSLEGSGLRCTPQRYAVMAFLMKHNRHPTAAEIFEAVNRADPRSSRAAARFRLSIAGLWIPDEWRVPASAAGGDCANGEARMGS